MEWKLGVESKVTGAQHEGAGTMQRRQGPEGQGGHSKEEEGEATDQESWSHPDNWLTANTDHLLSSKPSQRATGAQNCLHSPFSLFLVVAVVSVGADTMILILVVEGG